MSRAASRAAPARTRPSSAAPLSRAASPTPRWQRDLRAYFWRSELPLTTLLFLLPMICLYEVGTRYYASDLLRQTETRVLAFNLMRQFMELFGATGRFLPAFAVVAILITWHLVRRDRWDFHLGTAGLMAFESALLAVPLLAIATLVGQYLPLYAPDRYWQGGIVLSLGAGVYEELIFRLMSFTLLSILLIDLLKVERRRSYLLMVVGTAVLFALYHHWGPQGSPIRLSDFVFRCVAGLYFGILFMSRGFGVTAGCHAAYDIYYFALRALDGA